MIQQRTFSFKEYDQIPLWLTGSKEIIFIDFLPNSDYSTILIIARFDA